MKIKDKMFMRISFLGSCILGVLIFSGCAVFKDFGSNSGINYAFAKNGATVNASNYTAGRDLYTVINGITSSDEWDNGE